MRSVHEVRAVAIIGGGMAGLRTAEGLRGHGYGGRIVLLGNEAHLAYDRPPLSKGFLKGELDQEAITFSRASRLAEQGIEFTAAASVALDPAAREVAADDAVICYDRAVIATGATARRIPGIPDERHPLVLRTVDDALTLRERLARADSITIIGGGLIGCEIAATSRLLGLDVTLVEAAPTLMLRSMGPVLGGICEQLHRERGVRVITGAGLADLLPPAGVGSAWSVSLDQGESFTSDVVVAGIGAAPATAWLEGSGIAVGDGVLCDATLTTSDPDVMAAGDVARFGLPDGTDVRAEQWLSAVDQARHVAANLLRPAGERAPFAASDYFWTSQYGLMIQGIGMHVGAEIRFEQFDPAAQTFLARAARGEETVGVYAAGSAREFAVMRRAFARQ
jgi:NADPH-dependent 2,4-dienoyl-CoA reductase/sulfur reductase-like enzyme